MIERGFGHHIDFNSLVAGERVYLAESTYSDVATLHAPTRRLVGPHYIVTLYQNDEPAIAVSVAAYSSDLSVATGRLMLPLISGNEFRYVGVRSGYSFPIDRERALAGLRTVTDAPIDGEPRLVAPPVGDFAPLYPRWRFALARAITVATDENGTEVATSSLYVNHQGEVLLGVDENIPSALTVNGVGPAAGTLVVPKRLGIASRFHKVSAPRRTE